MAGYQASTRNTAEVDASGLLSNANIQEELTKQLNERLEIIKKHSILEYVGKRKLLSKIALDAMEDEKNVSVKAIAELNKMDGDYAPVKTKNVNQNFTFIQEFEYQEKKEPTEMPVHGEIVDD